MEKKIVKPTSVWLKPVSIKPKFLTEVLAGVIKLTKGDLEDGLDKIVNSLFDSEVKHDPQEKAWILVYKSILKTVNKLLHEVINEEDINNIVFEEMEKKVRNSLCEVELKIDNDFFDKPADNLLIKRILDIFGEFLETLPIDKVDSVNLKSRFPRYYIAELSREWSKNHNDYSTLLEIIAETPFDKIRLMEDEWFISNESIRLQAQEPMFGETFSINDIYVKLRGYYLKKDSSIGNDEKSDKKIVVEVETEIKKWIIETEKENCLKIISGGPGFGKSTTLKMLASEITFMNNDYHVLYIPLHTYDLKDDFKNGVRNFLKYGTKLKSVDPFEEEKLLIIFDGLDELAMRGKSLEIIAKDFISDIKKELSLMNQKKIRIKVILSGRDIIIQNNASEFRKEGEIIHLLPFYIENSKKNYSIIGKEKYIDDGNLLQIDQRDIWWKKYGELKGKGYSGLPDELKLTELTEVTAYPLLNYLLALSYERKAIEFNQNTNINSIYEDLIKGVYERNWSGSGTHKAIDSMEYEEFFNVFEKISISIWHGSGRKTTVNEIKSECNGDKTIEKFICDGGKGLISLLVAFYFKKSGMSNSGEDSFEFTHKSFGEFLTAKRILKNIVMFKNQLLRKEKDPWDGKDEKEIAKNWTELFGYRELDSDILRFIDNELKIIYIKNPEEVEQLQKYIIKIFNFVLQNGTQTETEEYNKANTKAIYSEKAFFYILGNITKNTGKISEIKWKNKTQFGEMISRLAGQRQGANIELYKYFNNLNLAGSILDLKDLYSAKLSCTNLSFCELILSILVHADLRGANLRGANLRDANLRGANLEGADLRKANLDGANLEGVNLRGANLEGADLEGADLRKADLRGANLEGVNLRGAKLRGAKLERVNLRGTKLEGADLIGAKLEEVTLKKPLNNKNL